MNKVVIGLEVHTQLNTNSKLFCSCSTKSDLPNSSVCEVCLGFPGSKPKINKKALDYGLKVALALNCEINKEFYFSRKTYFYPDLAKNFQITQYEVPLGKNGIVFLDSGKKVRIRRIHLEEDPASLVHSAGISTSSYCLIDYNRSGIPLVEIVTEPDINSPSEAREFLNKLITILEYLGVFVVGESVLKCDANISIEGYERVEIKNINGFKNVEVALTYEEKRQRELISKGEKISRETRGFDDKEKITYSMRTKETEEDYGYIAEPDLPIIEVSEDWLKELKREMPELPEQKAKRFVEQYKITNYDAKVLCSNYSISLLYEDICKEVEPTFAAKFVTREIMGVLNYNDLTLKQSGIEAKEIIELLRLVNENRVSEKNAKQALIRYVLDKIKPREFLAKENLLIDKSEEDIYNAVKIVLANHKNIFEDYKQKPDKVINFVVGQTMRHLRGKAEPRIVQKLVRELLEKGKM
ncbi:MAG: Asp-tRNA(Asn)/Glu-tRNA(Gln) amidotransferase subunit GatB [Candidatus Diapherotrites archaeon]|nr:Asp-tRNA(Asn)/Glu-tRNA(Gln) amidotransferase subunit GatB [Candidatus Diapherotrites archaeon]